MLKVNMLVGDKYDGYDFFVYGVDIYFFYFFYIFVFFCIIVSFVLVVIVLVLFYKVRNIWIFFKWIKSECFVVYLVVCDGFFNLVYFMDYFYILVM